MCVFKSITPYYLGGFGKLEKYPNNIIQIRKRAYSVDGSPFRQINRCEHITIDDDGYLLNEKYVFRICQEDNNNREICIKLNWFKALLYCASFMDFKHIASWIWKGIRSLLRCQVR